MGASRLQQAADILGVTVPFFCFFTGRRIILPLPELSVIMWWFGQGRHAGKSSRSKW